jgi:hypothetical protein
MDATILPARIGAMFLGAPDRTIVAAPGDRFGGGRIVTTCSLASALGSALGATLSEHSVWCSPPRTTMP